MSEPSSFIKLDRVILSWRWYTDGNTLRLFIHLLLKANYEAKDWHNITVKRGELITSLGNLSAETGLSVKEVRTALEHLKRTNEVASRSNSKCTVITILNYDKYQGGASQAANEGQAKGKQGATTKEIKEDKEINTFNAQREDDAECIVKLPNKPKPKRYQPVVVDGETVMREVADA